jgi:SAM-dependent methyltransferase
MSIALSSSTMDPRLLADIIRWDVHNWSQALDFWERAVDWNRVEHCLELGARDGGLSLWMALKHKSVVCSDIEDPSARAREHHARYHLAGAIEYATIDATSIPYENHFDVIAFKSMLGGVGGGDRIDRQRLAIDQMHKALRPGGYLLFAENLAGSPLHRLVRKRFIHWGRWWRYVTMGEMRTFLRQFSRVELRSAGVLAALGRSERQRRVLAAVDRAIVAHVTPKEWRYLVYGVAQK